MKHLLSLFTFLIIFYASHSQANDYVVKNIKVDVTADSATEARTKALGKARMNAFNVLKNRIVPESEKNDLPASTNSVVSTKTDEPAVGQKYTPQFGQSELYGQYQKQKNENESAQRYKMQINLNSLRQWVNLQSSLQSIGRLQIQSLKSNRAIVELSYMGNATALQNTLSMKGLQLYSNPAGGVTYILMVRG